MPKRRKTLVFRRFFHSNPALTYFLEVFGKVRQEADNAADADV
jgi:hypothetical protein